MGKSAYKGHQDCRETLGKEVNEVFQENEARLGYLDRQVREAHQEHKELMDHRCVCFTFAIDNTL